MQMQQTHSEMNITDHGNTACGGALPNTQGYPSVVYRGERIYFCTAACLRVFEQHPDAFMAGKIEHPLT